MLKNNQFLKKINISFFILFVLLIGIIEAEHVVSVGQQPTQGQIEVFLKKSPAEIMTNQKKAFLVLSKKQKNPSYQSGMQLLNNKAYQELYAKSLSEIQGLFRSYSISLAKLQQTFAGSHSSSLASLLASMTSSHIGTINERSLLAQLSAQKSLSEDLSLSLQKNNSQLEAVLSSYKKAMDDFIVAQDNRGKEVVLDKSDMSYIVCQKIIAPSISSIEGYACVVSEQFSKKMMYHDDLKRLFHLFNNSCSNIKNLAGSFPANWQLAIIQGFYEKLAPSLVTTCYQIVQHLSFQKSLKSQDLGSAYTAYQLAWAAQSSDMEIDGVKNVASFKLNITKFMVDLFTAAIITRNNSLTYDLLAPKAMAKIQKEIHAYHAILYNVYHNAGQYKQADAQEELALATKVKKNIPSQVSLLKNAEANILKTAQDKIVDGSAAIKSASTIIIENIALKTAAEAAEKQADFVVALVHYAAIQSACLQALSVAPSAPEASTLKAQYFVAKTRWTACRLASTVIATGSESFYAISSLPTKYQVEQYLQPIALADLGMSALPASLQLLPSKVLVSILSKQQLQDVKDMFKSYIVSQLLEAQSIRFVYVAAGYQLAKKAGISVSDAVAFDAAVKLVASYINSFKDVQWSVEVTSDAALVIALKNMPISAVDVLYQSSPSAIDYYIGAKNLFASGSSLVSLYGALYVPGSDLLSSTLMLKACGAAYASQAQIQFKQAQEQMARIVEIIRKSGVGAPSLSLTQGPNIKMAVNSKVSQALRLPSDFSSEFEVVKKNIIRAQSLLIDSDQSAYTFFLQAGMKDQAQATRAAFLQMYQVYISFMKKCLVGSPFSSEYKMLLGEINRMYLQWASELSTQLHRAQVASINRNIVELLVSAGEQCYSYPSSDTMIPGFVAINYKVAAKYFAAAASKYRLLDNASEAEVLENKVKKSYFLSSNQDVQLYYYIKNHGISYKSAMTGQILTVTFDKLLSDYENMKAESIGIDGSNGLMDAGELQTYNKVQNLLLSATMTYQYLAQEYQKMVPVVTGVVSASSAAVASKARELKILSALKSKNIISQASVIIPYAEQGICEKILKNALDLYEVFKEDFAVQADWMNVLIKVVQQIYSQDYLGAKPGEDEKFVAIDMQDFFDAVQKEVSSMQNPASAYVG